MSSLSGKLGVIDPCVDLGIDFVECALERGIDGAEDRECGGKARADRLPLVYEDPIRPWYRILRWMGIGKKAVDSRV